LCVPATTGATTGSCSFIVCPTAQGLPLDTLANVDANLFKMSCVGCHDSTRHAGGMDLSSTDLAVVKSTILAMKTSPAVTVAVQRVRPGDPDASLLIKKLQLTSGAAGSPKDPDPMFGNGMPASYPGSVCPQTISALRTWIQSGTDLQ